MSSLLQNKGKIIVSSKNKSSVSWNEHFLFLVVGTPIFTFYYSVDS